MPTVTSRITTHFAISTSYDDKHYTTSASYVQYSLKRKFMIFEYELGRNAAKASKNICCAKGDNAGDHNTVTGCWSRIMPHVIKI